MGLIELLTGWKRVKTEEVNSKIIRIINYKINKIINQKMRRASKTARLGRTIRHVQILPNISGCTVYARGKTFNYKAIQPKYGWIDNHGHGGFVTQPMQIYRKLRKK